jgi:hypothetical protein
MDYDNDCESIFREDVIDKKKTGRGMYGKTNFTRKRNGGMPSDMLKGKKLREYMGNSEVTTYNLNDVQKVGKSRKPRTRITPEMESSICELYKSGAKRKVILSMFDISGQALRNVLMRNKVYEVPGKPNIILPVSEAYTTPDVVAMDEPEIFTEEPEINYKWELEHLQKKNTMLKEENEKYRIALLNLALRMF